jgi:TolB-like protein/Flp pilus assembly protein TadD
MHFRVGVNLGDVIEEDDGTIYGDGVNIAARMEALADSGGICVASSIYDAVEGKLDFGFDYLGEQPVKNVAKPVRVYRVRTEAREPEPAPAGPARHKRGAIITAAAVAVVLVAGGVIWALYPKAPAPEMVTAEGTATDDPVLALPSGPSIAVLPFANLTGDPEEEFFSDGITEEIISALTQFRDLFVLARNTTFQYKGQAVDIKKLGSELDVRYVLEGSVRRASGTIRVTAQLVDASNGAHLWSETYDRDLTATNILSVQDDVTSQVVATIADESGILFRADLERAKNKATDNLDAYECVLRARVYRDVMTPEEHLRVRDCLERAVELDPDYSAAWAYLAEFILYEHMHNYNSRANPLDRALESARRAVELDPSGQAGHFALAYVHLFRGELDKLLAETERALSINPNNTRVLADLGYLLFVIGQHDRGVALTKKAVRLNPRHPDWYNIIFFWNHYHKREYEEALATTLKMDLPGYFYTYVRQAIAYGQLGRKAEAQTAVAKLLELKPEYGREVRDLVRRWQYPEDFIEHIVEGLRKAGLDVPDEAAASQ